jgi:hypothetical protein
MNFSNDSLLAPSNDAVNDISALIKRGAGGSIQKFINNYWGDLVALDLTSTSNFPILNQHPKICGAYYAPSLPVKGSLSFALLSSKSFSNIKSEIQSLNSSVFTTKTKPTDGDCSVITVGRRSGYYYTQQQRLQQG